MKKIVRWAAVLLAFILCFTGCRMDVVPQESTQEKTTLPPTHSITGIVQEITAHTLSILTDSGVRYQLHIGQAQMYAEAAPCEAGASVEVVYTGLLDNTQERQDLIQLISIKVLVAAPAVSANADADKTQAAAVPPDPAENFLLAMSLEEKVGQMFLSRCPVENGAAIAAQYALGGYLLFARDFVNQTPEGVSAVIQSYQAASKIRMFVGVDEEGGTVNRISQFSAFRSVPFPSPRALYDAGGYDAVAADAGEKAALLKSLGVNINFAPVCDVSVNPADFIYNRALGLDAQSTAQFVEVVVNTYNAAGLGSVLKHFPGYGGNGDTHVDLVHDPRPLDVFRSCDFLPFQAGIQAGAPCVLVAHNIMQAVDGERPASLSPAVHQLLREELGFGGVIITDDLAMGAVKQYAEDTHAAVQAVLAGNDMLICTNFAQQIPAVLAAVQTGVISQERIDESVLRILRWKIQLGLI